MTMGEFINIYRMNQCLWNNRSKEYTDKKLRNKAYEELLQKCKESYPAANKEFVIKKIHTLRCSFRRELRKIRRSKASGCSTEDLYVPSLWYYDLMKFITGCEVRHRGVSKFDDEKEENESVKNDIQNEDSEDSNTVSETPSTNCKQKSNVEQDLSSIATIPLQQHNVAEAIKNQIDDKFDVMGKKIAFDLRCIDQHQLIIAEKLISDTIYYAKLGRLNENATITVPQKHQMPYSTNLRQNVSSYKG
ncbi:PREDICTED: uncharacterized protein LOC107189650 [Dufourea novaeangliae]|uniref:uncharacterized protein LOC107189650 n=1 Tax=Dufourea novaeangliae TaxID=178035 RepID=UPI000767D5AD|nr:PREDICTED: uncharacterized protein LOC107189650 [Dufourea novaeangliae]